MLFMSVFTYPPDKRNEVIRRRAEKGPLAPSGTKLIGEWSYAAGRVFRLFEVDDPVALVEGVAAWSDLGNVEIYPVIEVEKVLPVAEKMIAAAAY